MLTAFRLFIFLSSNSTLSYILCFCWVFILTLSRRGFLFAALVRNFSNIFCSFFEYLIGILNGRCKSSHFLFRALIIKLCIFSNISRVEEGTILRDAYWVSSAMKTTLNKLLSGVGSLAIYLVYFVLLQATRGNPLPLPKLFILLRISTTYILI